MAAAIKSLTRVRFLKISNTVGWRYRDRGSLPPDAGNPDRIPNAPHDNFSKTSATGSNPDAPMFQLSGVQVNTDDVNSTTSAGGHSRISSSWYFSYTAPYEIYQLYVATGGTGYGHGEDESPYFGSLPPEDNVHNEETFLWAMYIEFAD